MGAKCPLVGEECWEHGCTWYIHVVGKDPQTGAEKDHWGCSVAYIPLLMVAGSNEMRQMGAAVESLRNETVKRQDALLGLAVKRRRQGEASVQFPDNILQDQEPATGAKRSLTDASPIYGKDS
jgi:hypothetical protein